MSTMKQVTTTTNQRIAHLVSLGFDLTERHKGSRHCLRIKCSQCRAFTVNGVPCHERGCRNEMKECDGCGNIVPRNQKYCQDCT
jgi:hypothetical protein